MAIGVLRQMLKLILLINKLFTMDRAFRIEKKMRKYRT